MKEVTCGDNFVDILDSFQPGWGKKEYMDNFIAILKDRVIPTYSFMDSKIENGRAIDIVALGTEKQKEE